MKKKGKRDKKGKMWTNGAYQEENKRERKEEVTKESKRGKKTEKEKLVKGEES